MSDNQEPSDQDLAHYRQWPNNEPIDECHDDIIMFTSAETAVMESFTSEMRDKVHFHDQCISLWFFLRWTNCVWARTTIHSTWISRPTSWRPNPSALFSRECIRRWFDTGIRKGWEATIPFDLTPYCSHCYTCVLRRNPLLSFVTSNESVPRT